MTTVDNHHIVNTHSSVSAIQVTDNGSSIQPGDGKVVVDEEIDSCEGEDYDEKKMFQVALVNSVMDTGGSGNVPNSALNQPPGGMSPRSKERYALRKRRRPGEEAALEMPNDPLNELQHVQDNAVASTSIHLSAKIKQEPPQQQAVQLSTHGTVTIKQQPQQQQNSGVTTRGRSMSGTSSKPLSSLPSLTIPAPHQISSNGNAPLPGIQASNTTMPGNHTNTKKKTSRKRKVKPPKVAAKSKVSERLSMPVPNPLLASTSPAQHPVNHSLLRGRQNAIVSSTSSVPCPIPVPSPLDAAGSMEVKSSVKVSTPYIPPFDPTKLTKISETSAVELPVQTRTRVFSVDLDPSTFDFSDLSSITGGNVDNKTSDSDLPIFQGRDRAFSFEVFNFAGGDDLLPNPVQSSSMLQTAPLAPVNVEAPAKRPRGDSIIFDPASFQDGGIHEKNALEKARFKDLLPASAPQQSLSRHTNQRRGPAQTGGGITGTYSTSQSSNPLPLLLPPGSSLNHATPMVAGQNRIPHPAHSNGIARTGTKGRQLHTSTAGGAHVVSSNRNTMANSVQIATLPSSLSAGAASSAQSPPTFQMELLNKDGRIGIYLPEARRLRIARFHAKRKMRIWRKRIKYDCRKKLADSRPRIKGRFVKRSDLD